MRGEEGRSQLNVRNGVAVALICETAYLARDAFATEENRRKCILSAVPHATIFPTRVLASMEGKLLSNVMPPVKIIAYAKMRSNKQRKTACSQEGLCERERRGVATKKIQERK